MMESSAKTSSSDHNAFITSSTAHLLLPTSSWISSSSSAAHPMFCPRTTAFAFNLNNHNDDDDHHSIDAAAIQLRGDDEIPKLSLFEKPLTPSDVGKLNRLVIPKQHAEKYFPLNGGADGAESGMLLSFEDELGKSWRFRYSYWNSSQSYVLTKGWSRFVKEKRLDAGDVVVFARHRADSARLFIGWRRRSVGGGDGGGNLAVPAANGSGWNDVHNSNNSSPAFYSGNPNNYWNQHQIPPSLHHHHPQDFDLQTAGSVLQKQVAAVSGHSKRFRLFGVNLECLCADDPEPMSTQHHQYYTNHMDATFSGAEDAYQHHHQG